MASLDGSLSVARARRRPTRYSPELSTATATATGTAANTPQHQQSEMCIGGLLASTPEALAAQLQQELQEHQLLHRHQEENGEEANDVDNMMAPSAKRSANKAGKPKRRYKKRQTLEDGTLAKRPRVANVLLENEMLIDEIRARKALWMRTHEKHHSNLLTTPLWEEIAKVLDTTQDVIRKRWKSLKDHYRRELKKTMTDTSAPPSVWPYYKKMRFMKSQMFVSLRRKNGEDHLEILSDDEEDINNQWHGQEARKQEGGSDTMDDYELGDEYNEMVKFEQHMQHISHGTMDVPHDGEEEEEEEEQQPDDQEEQLQEQEELSPIAASLQDQEDLSALQQQAAELSEMTTLRQQPVITSDIPAMTTIADMVDPSIVTTTASSLTAAMHQRADMPGRLSALQQHASDLHQRSDRLSALQQNQQPREMNGDLEEMTARHTALQQRQAEINSRLSALQRTAEMSAIRQSADITALHERAQMTALQQRAEMQQRNGVVDNGVDGTNGVSPIIGDDRGGISDDYHFFMSLMPHVRHFNSLQKLKVRNRIQQIIIEESSNIQYDPLANC